VVLSDTGLPPDGFDQPQPQVFFGVWHDGNSGAAGVLEDVMRTVHPVQLPPGPLHIPYQVIAGQWCVWYTLMAIYASGVLLIWMLSSGHHV
jgi:hypothetical protein